MVRVSDVTTGVKGEAIMSSDTTKGVAARFHLSGRSAAHLQAQRS